MEETIESVAKWADETFGLTRPVDALDRAFVEIDELKAKYDPNCIFPYRTGSVNLSGAILGIQLQSDSL